MPQGYHKIGEEWYECNDAGVIKIGAGKCGDHDCDQTWDDGNLKKRCFFDDGKLITYDTYCIDQGKYFSASQLIFNGDVSKKICRRESDGSLQWQDASEEEIAIWLKRYTFYCFYLFQSC